MSSSSLREFSLDLLEVDVNIGPQILECLLHCIFFVRAFGIVEPLDQVSLCMVC
jgi:hypothetical protein